MDSVREWLVEKDRRGGFEQPRTTSMLKKEPVRIADGLF